MKEFNTFDILLLFALPFVGFVAATCVVALAVGGGILCLRDCFEDWKWNRLKLKSKRYVKPWEYR